jgi:hypothetical protein
MLTASEATIRVDCRLNHEEVLALADAFEGCTAALETAAVPQSLSLKSCGMMVHSASWVEFLGRPAVNSAVTSLSVMVEELYPPSLAILVRAVGSLRALRRLVLADCMLPNHLCDALAQGILATANSANGCSGLEYISLEGNNIGSSGLLSLTASLGSLPRLREIVLDRNPVGDICAAEEAADSTVLGIPATPGYDPRGLLALARAIRSLMPSVGAVSLQSCGLAQTSGQLAGADRGGVMEMCLASRDRRGAAQLRLQGNGFSERTKKALHLASGFTCLL